MFTASADGREQPIPFDSLPDHTRLPALIRRYLQQEIDAYNAPPTPHVRETGGAGETAGATGQQRDH